ncbi:MULTISPECIES: GNAT family N-acetyltransferase [Roseobacteraceae]|uniref:GNAT family N-acetyltransferase n=1 Tax=Roseobacteraceae TaxID=2854170 RepID=UPI002B279B6B|nr:MULTISPECIES: GNAT family N-acetyltransferase [Roseobacteraceae]
MQEVGLRRLRAEDVDWLTRAHGRLYARDEGFDGSFEGLVGEVLAAFLASHDPARERGFIAWRNGQRLGSIFCTCEDAETSRLRLFLLLPQARGQGLGRWMLGRCMGFARAAGYRRMVLATHRSHAAACALYARTGWQLTQSRPVTRFGVALEEVHWQIDL